MKKNSNHKIKIPLTFFLILFFIGIGLSEIVARSISFTIGTATGKSSAKWFQEQWKPINELGYRDYPIRYRVATQKKIIFIVGDSFSAGHGVKFSETYAAKLKELVGNQYEIFNISQLGASTKKEIENLTNFINLTKIKPDIIIHQYFFNDIEDYITFSSPPKAAPITRWLAKNTAIFNLVHSLYTYKTWGESYIHKLKSAYENEEIFKQHLADINHLHRIIAEQNAEGIYLIFPSIYPDEQLEISKKFAGKLKENFLFQCNEGAVLFDTYELIKETPPKERIVNLMDTHPSPKLHAKVGNALMKILTMPVTKRDAQDSSIIACNQPKQKKLSNTSNQ